MLVFTKYYITVILNIGETICLSRRIKEKLVQGMKIHQVYFSPMNTYTDDERMDLLKISSRIWMLMVEKIK